MNQYDVLKQYFGYTSFRGGQEQLIDSVLEGRDVLGIMPTGGGKSICYQIPAMLFEGITLVISPLISLMKDQVMALGSVNIAAAYINSSLTAEQIARVYRNLQNGVYKILYIAPERLDSYGFAELARHLPISMVAVDEAHCISQWGNDFRPSYLRITTFIASLPRRPVVAAFTATATEQVRLDIEQKLRLCNPVRMITGFDRPNLKFEVITPRRKADAVLELVSARRDKSGIVYCMTRANVEKICELLQENGIAATRYHAGLSDRERQQNQEDFVYDRQTVMVATNAFGMGIDKSNVSYVIHYNMPLSLEAYYQEAGRAGRDGEKAECILLYAPSDIMTAKTLLEHTEGNASPEQADELRRRDHECLDRMVAYCRTTNCLRGNILDYFGQMHAPTCGNCGNCLTTFMHKDITVESQKILSCIKRMRDHLGYSVGSVMLVRVLRGSKDKRIVALGLDALSTYGIMAENSRQELNEMLDRLAELGYIYKNTAYATVALSETARNVLFDGERVTMASKEVPQKASKKKRRGESQNDSSRDLYERLRKLRFSLALEQNVPAYVVFSNATLADMADKKPTDLDAFMEVSGVGRAKAALYSEPFLAEINAYIDRYGE